MIRIVKFPFGFQFTIQDSYKSRNPIIPIGCDCHPSYFLKVLKARNGKLPFDWINSDPIYGLEFVRDNICNGFEDFLRDLKKTGQGRFRSKKYAKSEFFHEGDLFNPNKIAEMNSKILKFKELTSKNPCSFLYNIPSKSLSSMEKSDLFLSSVFKFMGHLNENNQLHIYIRFDESFNENENYCSYLIEKLNEIPNVKTARFLRRSFQFNTWGDIREYPKLFRELNLGDEPTRVYRVSRY